MLTARTIPCACEKWLAFGKNAMDNSCHLVDCKVRECCPALRHRTHCLLAPTRHNEQYVVRKARPLSTCGAQTHLVIEDHDGIVQRLQHSSRHEHAGGSARTALTPTKSQRSRATAPWRPHRGPCATDSPLDLGIRYTTGSHAG